MLHSLIKLEARLTSLALYPAGGNATMTAENTHWRRGPRHHRPSPRLLGHPKKLEEVGRALRGQEATMC